MNEEAECGSPKLPSNGTMLALAQIGFVNLSKITESLQGSIWRGVSNGQSMVVKMARRSLWKHGLAEVNGKLYPVKEDILNEAKIMKHLTAKKDSRGIVKFHCLLSTKNGYYLVMEDGGSSLLRFVIDAHEFLRSGHIERSHWKQVVKLMFRQMAASVALCHRSNICHFDVSLENFLVNDMQVQVTRDEQGAEHVQFSLTDIRVKLCDFGLAEYFGSAQNASFLSSKWVGKDLYKSPEVVARQDAFNAKQNDVWCLGVCLFMLVTGGSPWSRPCYLSRSDLQGLVDSWQLTDLVDDQVLDLLARLFQPESKRATLDTLLDSPYVSRSDSSAHSCKF